MDTRPMPILLRGLQLPNATIHIMTQTNGRDSISLHRSTEQPLVPSQVNLQNCININLVTVYFTVTYMQYFKLRYTLNPNRM
jgi:hypothetical protein